MPDDRTPIYRSYGSDARPGETKRTAWRPGVEGRPPEVIGPYRLRRLIGDGGMGEVWEAEQREPVERRVALKLVKLGMDTREFVARFEAERQALALMEHPCIAQVFDGGATPEGRPYFAMEYVEGCPITQFCDERDLDTTTRLELFARVCDGVQHAHQKGVLHRDLKPSNVMVREVDGEPQPKIIDFGVAKATTSSLTDKTVKTRIGGWIGTPAYMSPEQAMITDDFDTRTDVYSLGVLLYELLTGSLPFEETSLDSASFDEIRRIIQEVEPPRPSSRISTRASGRSDAASQNRLRELGRRLEGDLDCIVVKALEKDRERRYDSPAALARDVRRHLADEPIVARPPSLAYRAEKFVRRNRIGVAFAGLGAMSLVALLVLVFFYTVRLQAERTAAQTEAARARAVSGFLTSLFEEADPLRPGDEELTARDLLERGAERVETELIDSPDIQSTMMQLIGRVSRRLGDQATARSLLEQAVDLERTRDPQDRLALAGALYDLGVLEFSEGNYEQAMLHHTDALFQLESRPDPAPPAQTSRVLRDLILVYKELDRTDDAQAAGERALSITQAQAPNSHEDLGITHNNLGLLHRHLGDFQTAVHHLEKAVEHFEQAPEMGLMHIAPAMANLASSYEDLGRRVEAEQMLLRSLEIYEERVGPDHPNVGSLLINLGSFAIGNKQYDRADEYLIRARPVVEKAYGPGNYRVGLLLANQAEARGGQGRAQEALELVQEAGKILEQSIGPDHPNTILVRSLEGEMRLVIGDADGARLLQKDAVFKLEQRLGSDHALLSDPLCRLAQAQMAQNDRQGASASAQRCFDIRVAALGPEHASTLDAQQLLATYGSR